MARLRLSPTRLSPLSWKSSAALKRFTADVVVAHLTPIQQRLATIDDAEIERVLVDGAARARALASANYRQLSAAVGLLPSTQ